MIVPRGRQIWRMLVYVGTPLLVLAVYDLAVVLAVKLMHWNWVALPHIPLALYGGVIGVIMGFRNQTCYSRWWEGRTLWGAVVNNTRSWARQVTTVMRPRGNDDAIALKEMQRRLVYYQIAFAHSLRQHLRRLDPWLELAPLLDETELNALRAESNIPLALQQRMGSMLTECRVNGWIEAPQWRAMDDSLNDLTDAMGGTERLKNTPMPKQYDFYPQLFVHLYCVLLPLALVTDMGWFTPLGSTAVGFMFLALDKIGRDLEDPFDNTVYDVPMTSLTNTIERNLRQMLGETDLPPVVTLVRGVLW